jgi:hypothetical protein
MISDKATPDPRFPPLPVKLYPVGRFVVPVPEGLEFRSSSLSMNKIAVTEITWKPGKDREQQFRDLWMPVRDEARKNYDRRASMGRATQGGFAEQDLSELFGHPAMLLCYQSKRAWHHIDTFIALPEYVLHLKEDRLYDIGVECLDMEAPILKFFKHYHVGHRDVGPDSFLTPKGRIEGIKPWAETVHVGCCRNKTESRPDIHFSIDTGLYQKPTSSPVSKSLFRADAKKAGIAMEILRSRQWTLAGMVGLEEVYILSTLENAKKESDLYAKWEYQGEGGNPEKPFGFIELSCDASAKDDALRMWDAIMNNFTTIRAWHEKTRGGSPATYTVEEVAEGVVP